MEIRESCENCDKTLPNTSSEAMICTYDCTFCSDCVADVLYNVCPNCGGGFEKRPTRPKEEFLKNPARKDKVLKPIDPETFTKTLQKYQNIDPRDR